MVGERLFEKILETAKQYLPPFGPCTSLTFSQVVDGIREIAVYFYLRGYCLKEPTVSGNDGRVTVLFVGPATLWGTQALSQLHCVPNEYDALATTAFVKASGWFLTAPVITSTSESTITRHYSLSNLGVGGNC
jgi:hypothetical protein